MFLWGCLTLPDTVNREAEAVHNFILMYVNEA